RSLRGPCQGVVGRHRLHLKDDAPLPVGRAHRPLVRTMGSPAWRGTVGGSGLAPRSSLVWSGSPKAGVEATNRRRNRGALPGTRIEIRLLEATIGESARLAGAPEHRRRELFRHEPHKHGVGDGNPLIGLLRIDHVVMYREGLGELVVTDLHSASTPAAVQFLNGFP